MYSYGYRHKEKDLSVFYCRHSRSTPSTLKIVKNLAGASDAMLEFLFPSEKFGEGVHSVVSHYNECERITQVLKRDITYLDTSVITGDNKQTKVELWGPKVGLHQLKTSFDGEGMWNKTESIFGNFYKQLAISDFTDDQLIKFTHVLITKEWSKVSSKFRKGYDRCYEKTIDLKIFKFGQANLEHILDERKK